MPPYGAAICFSSKSCIFKAFRMRIAPKGTKHKEDAGLCPRQCAVATPQGRALLVRGFRRGVDRRTTDGRPYRFAMTETDFVYSLKGALQKSAE